MVTKYAQGTLSYRGPELMAQVATFTNKVDIWALGCVLHELATGKVAFPDWAVIKYAESDSDLSVPLPPDFPPFFEHHVSATIVHLLHRNPTERPNAASCGIILSIYSHFMERFKAEAHRSAAWFPSYGNWIQLLSESVDEEGFFKLLSNMYYMNKENTIADLIKEGTNSLGPMRRFAIRPAGGYRKLSIKGP